MRLAAYIALSVQTLIAAGTFLVAKDATGRFAPQELVWFRIVLAGILVSSAYLIVARKEPRPSGRDLATLAFLGVLGTTINQGFFLFGLAKSTPLHAALLYAFTPVFVLVGSRLFLGQPITGRRVAGLVLAVSGVALILTAQGLSLADGPLQGDLLILIAVAAWALYTVIGKGVLTRVRPFTMIAWAFLFGALSMIPFAPWVLDGFDFRSPGLRGWLDVLYLSAVTSGVAFTLWYYALRRLDATQVAVFTNLQPPATAVLAWMVYGTVPGPQLAVGGALVLAGVFAVQWRRRTA